MSNNLNVPVWQTGTWHGDMVRRRSSRVPEVRAGCATSLCVRKKQKETEACDVSRVRFQMGDQTNQMWDKDISPRNATPMLRGLINNYFVTAFCVVRVLTLWASLLTCIDPYSLTGIKHFPASKKASVLQCCNTWNSACGTLFQYIGLSAVQRKEGHPWSPPS